MGSLQTHVVLEAGTHVVWIWQSKTRPQACFLSSFTPMSPYFVSFLDCKCHKVEGQVWLTDPSFLNARWEGRKEHGWFPLTLKFHVKFCCRPRVANLTGPPHRLPHLRLPHWVWPMDTQSGVWRLGGRGGGSPDRCHASRAGQAWQQHVLRYSQLPSCGPPPRMPAFTRAPTPHVLLSLCGSGGRAPSLGGQWLWVSASLTT